MPKLEFPRCRGCKAALLCLLSPTSVVAGKACYSCSVVQTYWLGFTLDVGHLRISLVRIALADLGRTACSEGKFALSVKNVLCARCNKKNWLYQL